MNSSKEPPTTHYIDLATYDEPEKNLYGGDNLHYLYGPDNYHKVNWCTRQSFTQLFTEDGTVEFGKTYTLKVYRGNCDYLSHSWIQLKMPNYMGKGIGRKSKTPIQQTLITSFKVSREDGTVLHSWSPESNEMLSHFCLPSKLGNNYIPLRMFCSYGDEYTPENAFPINNLVFDNLYITITLNTFENMFNKPESDHLMDVWNSLPRTIKNFGIGFTGVTVSGYERYRMAHYHKSITYLFEKNETLRIPLSECIMEVGTRVKIPFKGIVKGFYFKVLNTETQNNVRLDGVINIYYNRDLRESHPVSFYSEMQPYQQPHMTSPGPFSDVYMYSYAQDMLSFRPTGSTNYSKIDVSLWLNHPFTENEIEHCQIIIVGVMHNPVQITKGNIELS